MGPPWSPDGLARVVPGGTGLPVVGTRSRATAGKLVPSPRACNNGCVERHPLCNPLIDAAPDAILLVSDRGRIVEVNPAAEILFGWSRDELVGKPISVLVPMDARPAHDAQVRAYTQAPHVRPMGKATSTRACTRDGRVFPVDIKLSPVTYDGEQLTTAIVRDMSTFAALHAELAAKARELEAANEALTRNNAELAQLSREKSELLGVAAHDLRNPLAAIRGFAELLGAEEVGPLSPAQIRVVGRVESTADHMLRLLNSVLDLAAIEAGRLELRRRDADLDELLRDVVAVERVFAEHKGIVLRVEEARTTLGRAFVDAQKLQQVLHNLLNNALKFSPRGASVVVRGWRDGALVRVAVADAGPGLSPTQAAALFRPSTVGPQKPTGGEPSAGLGLAIARRIVEAHGGRIQVESTPGAGATFTMELEAAQSLPASIPTSS